MSAKGLYFPYPTLGHLDDVSGQFAGNVTYQYLEGSPSIELKLDLDINNKEVSGLILSGKAAFGVEVECSATFLRMTEQTSDPKHKFEIAESKLRGKVTVTVFIITIEDLYYNLNSFHPDFGRQGFDVPAGYYIGWWGVTSFIADKTFDPLQAPASSFIKVRENKQNIEYLEVDYDEDIVIRIPTKTWKLYEELKATPKTHSVLHTSLVFPVLVEAIKGIQDQDSDISNAKLDEILRSRDLLETPPFIAAQKILQLPVKRAFEATLKIVEMSGGEN